tara:strand:+ start:681 stop:830 length:150 start_codon:yes stop_codon:yes gene_type:complete
MFDKKILNNINNFKQIILIILNIPIVYCYNNGKKKTLKLNALGSYKFKY